MTFNPRTGQSDPLRADRWFRHELEKDVDCAGIQCNIWERAKKRSLLTHRLAGGGEHNLGYHAVAWESICMANVESMEGTKYCLCSLTSWVDTCLSTILILMPAWVYRYCLKIGAKSTCMDYSNPSRYKFAFLQCVNCINCIKCINCIIDIKCIICIISDSKALGHS